jgi:NAD-dependent dihydropyrimidine dehydrogenase PreA subunit
VPEEVEEAVREGIRFRYRVGPKRFIGSDGTVTGVEFLDVSRVFDEAGRFAPTFVEGSESVIATDSVITAIGQTSDLSFLKPDDGVETRGGRILVDPGTLATTARGVYAGGDAAFGPRIAIDAVADGKLAARSIDELLRGHPRREPEIAVEIVVHSRYERGLDYEGVPRQAPPTRAIERRVGITEVEECLSPGAAGLEGTRCLHCWTNTIFEQDPASGTECILCGGCQDVCPEDCIEIVPSAHVVSVPRGAEEVEPGLGGPLLGAVMIKDEETCIRCGLCARRCPTGTITMQSYRTKERSVA